MSNYINNSINKLINEIISYYQRRIYIPKECKGLILDVGSGDKPHQMADILVDKYIENKYGVQRMGSASVKINKPIFDSDICNLPFKDKVFDYVIASHILEHVPNPRKAVEELVRVGKAGYIEVPYIGYQKIVDYYSHLWFCDYTNKTLIFRAKKDLVFDKDIDKFITEDGKRIDVGKIPKDKDKCVLKICWKDSINVKVFGRADNKLIAKISKTIVKHNKTSYLCRQLFEKIMSIVFFRKSKKVYMKNILKEELYNGKNILLLPKIYKL